MPLSNRQGGYALFMVAVLLTLFMVLGMQFLARGTTSTQMAGYTRDSAESLQLAENAMNMLYGQFAYGADLDGDGSADREEAALDPASPPALLPLPYLYYVTAGSGIDQGTPSVLQRVADGEARNAQATLDSQAIPAATDWLRIEALFGPRFAPRVYSQDADGNFLPSDATWATESSVKKAVAWLELVVGPSGELQLFACAAGQVGASKSYVQRLIGQFEGGTLGGSIGPLIQS